MRKPDLKDAITLVLGECPTGCTGALALLRELQEKEAEAAVCDGAFLREGDQLDFALVAGAGVSLAFTLMVAFFGVIVLFFTYQVK
jgi:hypothetical protein